MLILLNDSNELNVYLMIWQINIVDVVYKNEHTSVVFTLHVGDVDDIRLHGLYSRHAQCTLPHVESTADAEKTDRHNYRQPANQWS